jgi:hypothetical protein
LKAGLEAAAVANNRSVTAEIVARLEQSLVGPKHAPAIIARLEALPYGTPTQEISLGTFFENFSWTIRASVEALQEARSEENTSRPERSDETLGPTIDKNDDEAVADLAAERFREHVAARRERSRLKRLAKQAKDEPKLDE